jgi:galactose mutarotase-like enzyme
MTGVELRAGSDRLVLDPANGGRAASWVADDVELLTGIGDDPRLWGCYPMAPWAGRLRDNQVPTDGAVFTLPPTMDQWAIHGTVLDRPWQVRRSDERLAELSCALAGPWPWPGTVTSRWRLAPGSLTVTLRLEATATPFPASIGWHPWFRRQLPGSDPAELRLPDARMLQRGSDQLPTARLVEPPAGPYDDAFDLPRGVAGIRWAGRLSLRCRSDHRWFVVYDEQPDAVCLEPQTAPPDALRPDSPAPAALVTPGRPLTLTTHWTWAPDPGRSTHEPRRP